MADSVGLESGSDRLGEIVGVPVADASELLDETACVDDVSDEDEVVVGAMLGEDAERSAATEVSTDDEVFAALDIGNCRSEL